MLTKIIKIIRKPFKANKKYLVLVVILFTVQLWGVIFLANNYVLNKGNEHNQDTGLTKKLAPNDDDQDKLNTQDNSTDSPDDSTDNESNEDLGQSKPQDSAKSVDGQEKSQNNQSSGQIPTAQPGEPTNGSPSSGPSSEPPADSTPSTSSGCIPSSYQSVGWEGYKNANGLSNGALSDSSGTLTITTNNTVIERINHLGNIVIKASNVTIRQSTITASSTHNFLLEVQSGNLILEDVTLNGASKASNLVGKGNYTATRVYANSSTADAFKAQFDNVTLNSVWAWNPVPSPGAHADAIQTQGGENVYILCSHLDWRYRGGNFGAVQNPPGTAAEGGFGGQGIWATGGSNNIVIKNVFVAAMGFAIGTSGTNYTMCDIVLTSQLYADTIHGSANDVNTVKWWNVKDINGGNVPIPNNYTNVTQSPCS